MAEHEIGKMVKDEFLSTEAKEFFFKDQTLSELTVNEECKQTPAEWFDDLFINLFNKKSEEINQNAIDKGWWKGERNDGEMIALMHSELSEALEALRHGDPPDSHIPEFKGSEAELADVIIRIMDYSAAKGLKVAEAIIAKSEYNKTRPYKHGGKKF